MEEIEKLKVIGAKEISKKTHMALNKIEAILEMAYGNLEDKATTIGLIQILEREYHLDLHQWCQEYEKFWEEHKSNSEKMEANINFKISHETMQENDNKKSIIVVAVVIVLVALGIYLYFNFHNLQDIITEKETISTPKPESTLENLQEEGIIKEEAKSIETNATLEMQENNATQEILEPNVNLDSSASTPINELPAPQAIQEEIKIQKEVKIVPFSQMWVGIIYLDTKEKTSFLINEPLKVDLKRPQTIITGHGMLEIQNNDNTEKYNLAGRMRFFVDEDGNFSSISIEQYNRYNGGLGW